MRNVSGELVTTVPLAGVTAIVGGAVATALAVKDVVALVLSKEP
jgi:hypothetical protein